MPSISTVLRITAGLLLCAAFLLLLPMCAPRSGEPEFQPVSKREPTESTSSASSGAAGDVTSPGEKEPVVLQPIDDGSKDGLRHTLTLSFVGDCMLATIMGNNYPDTLNYEMDHRSPDFFFRHVSGYFRSDDWTVGNCENVFTDRALSPVGKDYRPAYWYRSAAKNAGIFKVAGIDVVSVCNNHAGDYGDAGYTDTLAALREAGVSAGQMDEPLRFEKYGFRITLLCSNLYSEYQAEYILRQIDAERESCDYLIVYFHGGTERIHQPEDWKKSACRKLIDRGADLVIGMHPHVLQPMEEYKGKLIFYSLGNFLFGGGRNEENRTAILQIFLTVENGALLNTHHLAIPCYLYTTKDQKDPDCWLPSPIEDEAEKQRVLDFLEGNAASPL